MLKPKVILIVAYSYKKLDRCVVRDYPNQKRNQFLLDSMQKWYALSPRHPRAKIILVPKAGA